MANLGDKKLARFPYQYYVIGNLYNFKKIAEGQADAAKRLQKNPFDFAFNGLPKVKF